MAVIRFPPLLKIPFERSSSMQNSSKRLNPAQLLVVVVIAMIIFGWFRNSSSYADQDMSTLTSTSVVSTLEETVSQTQVTPSPQPTHPQPTTLPSVTLSTSILPTKDFDYFVLALSWSPDYCASNGDDDPQQCSLGKKLGFVLHGLWPQNTKGYPSNCSTQKLPEGIKALFPSLFPADKLYSHEWKKHGTCTGLSAQQYFTLAKQIKQSVLIPDKFKAPPSPFRSTSTQLVEDFTTVNSGLDKSTLAVYCSGSGRYLSELYVCFSRESHPTACSAEVNKKASQSCRNADFLVRNTR